MRRVASLYLPQLPIERLRRPERIPARPEPRGPALLPVDDDPGACSVPRGGGWRPGARWARGGGSDREALQAQADALPLHQRPSIREMGRRSEAAAHPFRAMRPDEGGCGNVAMSANEQRPVQRPMILSTQAGQRETIFAACPAASALGLIAGMPVAQARAFVADLDVRPADPEADTRLIARMVIHALRHWTPVAASSPPDGLWLDLFGTAHLFGGEERFCRQVLGFFARLGFTATIAVADTSGAAHALARFGRSRVTIVAPGTTIDAIAPLPIEALRLSPGTVEAARRFGLDRIADVMSMPRAPLARRLGLATLTRLDQAIGREVEQIIPAIDVEKPLVSRQLMEAIGTPEAISTVIGHLVGDMAALLHARGWGARDLCMTFKRVDAVEQHVVVGTSRATRDLAHLTRLFRLKMETIDPGLGIESVRLLAHRVEPLEPLQVRAVLTGEDAQADLAPLIDQLAGRVGARAVFRTAPVESDVPERAVRRVHPLASATGWPQWRRPARLLRRPEKLLNVVALLPDHPPRRFSWRGDAHIVVAGDGPERIHGEWWVRDGEMWAVRDYFRVEDSEGRHYWVFRRGDGVQAETGDLSWWLHGVG